LNETGQGQSFIPILQLSLPHGSYSDFWRSQQPGGYFDAGKLVTQLGMSMLILCHLIAWGNGNSYCNIDNNATIPCDQGLVPIYVARVKSVADVQAAVKFAKARKVSTRVKVWVVLLAMVPLRFRPVEFNDTLVPAPNNTSPQGVVHSAAGEHWYSADQRGVIVVGGSSYSVGAAGGWVLGGGHSSLSPQYGLGVDIAPSLVLSISVNYTESKFRGLLKTYLQLQPELIAQNFSGYTYPYISPLSSYALSKANSNDSSSNSTDTFVTALVRYNSNDAMAANATLKPFFDYVQREQLNMTFSNVTLTKYIQQFDQPPDQVNEGAGQASVFGSRLLPPSLFEEGNIDGLVDFVINTPISPSFYLVAGNKVNRVAPDATAVHPSWRNSIQHLIVSSGWFTNTTFSERDKIRRQVTEETQKLAALVPAYLKRTLPSSPMPLLTLDKDLRFFYNIFSPKGSVLDTSKPIILFLHPVFFDQTFFAPQYTDEGLAERFNLVGTQTTLDDEKYDYDK
ncbi:9487_t:CDS:2, partial [Acaulospora colombiana]